jgi:hypothetical protein
MSMTMGIIGDDLGGDWENAEIGEGGSNKY